jgi:hypothetical protein
MSRLTIALIIAQNGLSTAASLLEAEARKAEAKSDTKKAASIRKLATSLKAVNAGVTEFLAQAG